MNTRIAKKVLTRAYPPDKPRTARQVKAVMRVRKSLRRRKPFERLKWTSFEPHRRTIGRPKWGNWITGISDFQRTKADFFFDQTTEILAQLNQLIPAALEIVWFLAAGEMPATINHTQLSTSTRSRRIASRTD